MLGIRPSNASEQTKYFERVGSVREAPTGASARSRRQSPVLRRLLLLLLLPTLVRRIDRRRRSHGKKQIAIRRFGRWRLLDLSRLAGRSDFRFHFGVCSSWRA